MNSIPARLASPFLALTLSGLATATQASDAYQEAVLADAPVLFYRCNETSGTTAANLGSLGPAANGTYGGGVSLETPSAQNGLGTAAALSGGFIRVPDLGLGSLAQFSLELWFKRNGDPASDFYALYANDAWAYGSLHLNLNGYGGSGAPMEFALNGNPNPWPAWSPGWTIGQWEHLVVTYDAVAGTVRAYLNGSLCSAVAAGTTPILLNGGEIGAWKTSRYLDGAVDEVAIYTNVLSASRVLAHYNSVQEAVSIATQPADAIVLQGRTASFSVVSTGPNPSYQWFKNGLPIAAANAASYTTPPTTMDDNGAVYFVEVSNTVNVLSSSDAVLTVVARPTEGYQATVVEDAPLVYYRFNEDLGTTAENLGSLGNSGNGSYGGAFSLGVAAPAGELGTALDLTRGYVQVPDLGRGAMTQVSMEVWLNRRSNPTDFFALFACSGWSGGQLHWNLLAGSVVEEFAVAGNPVPPRCAPVWALGEWHHLVATYDASSGVASTVKFYLDGLFLAQGTAGVTPINFSGGLIGAWTWSDPAEAMRFFDGQMDEFAIYDTVLTPAQVLRHFSAAAPPPPPYAAAVLADNPAVYYRFEESSGTLAENLGTLGAAADGAYAAAGVTLGEASAFSGLGKAVTLDGGSGTVRLPDLQMGLMSQATIECWLKRVSPPESMTALLAGDGFGTGDLHVNFPGAGPEFQFAVAGNSGFPTFTPAWAASEWHHLALTYSAPGEPGKVRCYLDGTLAGVADTSGTPLEFTGGQIGAWLNTFAAPPELQRFLGGSLDEFALYPTALPAERVVAHFAALSETHAAISREPTDAMVLEGRGATFSVGAQGTGLGYQWFKNGQAIPGATQASYATPSTTIADDGAVFFVRVSNVVNSVFSGDAILSVVSRPTGDYETTVLGDSPLLYYRFNETSGSTANNRGSLGDVADGIYTGGVALGAPSAQGNLGTAVELDGASGFVGVPDLGLAPLSQLSLEFWLQRRANSAELNAVFADDFWTAGALHLNLASAGSQLEVAINPYPTPPRFTPAWPADSWHHAVVTFDSAAGQVTVYLDGDEVGSAAGGTQPITFAGGQIGAWLNTFMTPPVSQRFLQGSLDEFAIYGTVLSRVQVMQHYGAARPVLPVLAISRVDEQLQLTWEGAGFILQENADITNAAGWSPVPGGSASPVAVTLDGLHKFYRLVAP